jgi:hypothetical protein
LLNQHRSFFCVASKIQVHEKEIVQYLWLGFQKKRKNQFPLKKVWVDCRNKSFQAFSNTNNNSKITLNEQVFVFLPFSRNFGILTLGYVGFQLLHTSSFLWKKCLFACYKSLIEKTVFVLNNSIYFYQGWSNLNSVLYPQEGLYFVSVFNPL